LHESEGFICKAIKGAAIPLGAAGLQALNNAADESPRLARRVKINEIK